MFAKRYLVASFKVLVVADPCMLYKPNMGWSATAQRYVLRLVYDEDEGIHLSSES